MFAFKTTFTAVLLGLSALAASQEVVCNVNGELFGASNDDYNDFINAIPSGSQELGSYGFGYTGNKNGGIMNANVYTQDACNGCSTTGERIQELARMGYEQCVTNGETRNGRFWQYSVRVPDFHVVCGGGVPMGGFGTEGRSVVVVT